MFVDRILSLESGKQIVTETNWADRPAILEAHFRGGPAVVPGVLLIEQAAQSGALLWRMSLVDERPLFLGRANCRFLKPVTKAMLITTVEATLILRTNSAVGFRATVSARGDAVATFQLAAGVMPNPARDLVAGD